MSRIILPNEAPRGARPLFVPHGYETPAILGYCRVPGCEREGAPFIAGQEELWQKHVGWCARRNRGNIEEASGSARRRGGSSTRTSGIRSGRRIRRRSASG
jgi:hypothetical protein